MVSDNPWATEDGREATGVIETPCTEYEGRGYKLPMFGDCWFVVGDDEDLRDCRSLPTEFATAILNMRAIEWLRAKHTTLQVVWQGSVLVSAHEPYNQYVMLATSLGRSDDPNGEDSSLAEALIAAVLKEAQ